MRLKSYAGIAVAALAASMAFAVPASATVFKGSYGITGTYNADPGFVVSTQDVTPGIGNNFTTANLTSVGQTDTQSLFNIWSDEKSVEIDDLIPKSISVNFSFTDPNSIADGSIGGYTGAFTGLIQGGYVNWTGGGNQTFDFGNGGVLNVHLDNAVFNEGFLKTSPGMNRSANVAATFSLDHLSAAVPEPSSWALMLVGFGGLGAILRRSRQQGQAATA